MKNQTYKLIYLPIIYYGLLGGILPYFYKDYKDRNTYELSTTTYVIIFATVLLIVSIFVLVNSREHDKLIKIIKSFAYGVFFGLSFTLYIVLVKDDTAFYLNRFSTKAQFEEKFKVTYSYGPEDKNSVGIRAIERNHWFGTTNKFSMEDFIYIQKHDTITLTYRIGLFNKPYLPHGKIEILR